MKTKQSLALLFFLCYLSLFAQESTAPMRQPEQEAKVQTERMKKHLELSPEQEKEIYLINLHYAKKRQISNSRSEAMQRTKNKNEDLKRVLTREQYEQMKRSQYERVVNQAPNQESEGIRVEGARTAPTDRRSPEERARELTPDHSTSVDTSPSSRAIDTNPRTNSLKRRSSESPYSIRSESSERTRRTSVQRSNNATDRNATPPSRKSPEQNRGEDRNSPSTKERRSTPSR